jgi:riboflavin biosynthesis pyrimidine reductase
MSALAPLETLFSTETGVEVPLTPELTRLYGPLQLPTCGRRSIVIGNFVETLDGVISFGIPGQAGGRAISGSSPHDRLVMGLLRAAADVVVVSAGSFRASSTRQWTAGAAYPSLACDLERVRWSLGKTEPPLTVIVTASGDLGDGWGAAASDATPILLATTPEGARRLEATHVPSMARIVVVGDRRLNAGDLLDAVAREWPFRFVLVEAGPQLMGDFIAERRLDSLFLTISPQIAGRDDLSHRPGFVTGKLFSPDDSRWGTLVNLKRAGSHLFLRYDFAREPAEGADERRLQAISGA